MVPPRWTTARPRAALLFLLELAHRPEFANDEDLQRAVKFGFDGLLLAQEKCGAWGQSFDGPADPSVPVVKARLPAQWSRVWPNVDYTKFYTLNDGTRCKRRACCSVRMSLPRRSAT